MIVDDERHHQSHGLRSQNLGVATRSVSCRVLDRPGVGDLWWRREIITCSEYAAWCSASQWGRPAM